MNEHERLNPLLPFYLAGTLDERQVEAVKAHLAVCSVCAADLAFWREVEAAGQTEFAPVKAPAGALNNALRTIAEEQCKPNPLLRAWQIIRAQIPMVYREIWPTSLLVLLLGFVITLLMDRAGFLFAIAPLVSVAGLAFIYNKAYDPAFELVLSTPVSQVQLLLARSGLVFGFNLVVVTLLGLGLSLHFSLEVVLALLRDWLAPMTFLSTLGLCFSIFTKSENAIAIVYTLWFSQYLPLTEEFQQLFSQLTDGILRFWQNATVLYALSLALLVFILFWVKKGTHFVRHLA